MRVNGEYIKNKSFVFVAAKYIQPIAFFNRTSSFLHYCITFFAWTVFKVTRWHVFVLFVCLKRIIVNCNNVIFLTVIWCNKKSKKLKALFVQFVKRNRHKNVITINAIRIRDLNNVDDLLEILEHNKPPVILNEPRVVVVTLEVSNSFIQRSTSNILLCRKDFCKYHVRFLLTFSYVKI